MNYLKAELYNLLKEDSRIFDFIQEAALDGLWYWDLEDPENEWMNPKFWKTLGYDPEEMPHKVEAWQNIIYPEDLKVATENFYQHCADPEQPYDQTVRYRHKEGHTVWIHCRGMAIRDNNGKPLRMLGAHNEITELKKQEELLLATNRVAKIGYWEIDLKKGTPHWSQTTRDIHEVPADYVPQIETAINFYKEGYSRDKISKEFNKVLEQGGNFDLELEIITFNGTSKWIRSIGISEFKNNSCVRLYGLFQDIDEKFQIKQSIEIEKKRYQQVIAGADLGSWELNLSSNKIGLNSISPLILGFTKEEFNQRFDNQWISLIHPNDKALFLEKLDALKTNKIQSLNMDCRVKNKNEDYLWLKINAKLFESSELFRDPRIVGTLQDINFEKETEAKLIISEEFFRNNFENAAIGMATLDPNGRWLRVNKKLADMIGYSEEELIGKPFQDFTHSADVGNDLENLHKLSTGEIENYQIEKRYIHKQGHHVPVLLGAAAVRNEKGEVINYISQTVDLSKRKQAEQKIEKLLHLEQERTERLNNFAHIVSHNLRSHSSGISKLIELINLEIPEINKNEAFNYLEDASSRLVQTVEHLNKIVEIQGATKENFHSCSIYDALDHAISSLSLEIDNSKITLVNEVSKNLKTLGLNAYLESIFYNFISNAIRYRNPEIEAKLTIRARTLNRWIRISFMDNGLGIDLTRHKKRLFGMYNTFHPHPEARGLGLFLTHNQVQLLGGRIDVESTEGEGANFNVYLPYEKN